MKFYVLNESYHSSFYVLMNKTFYSTVLSVRWRKKNGGIIQLLSKIVWTKTGKSSWWRTPGGNLGGVYRGAGLDKLGLASVALWIACDAIIFYFFLQIFCLCYFTPGVVCLSDPFLGSGPKGVDDLCFHTFGEFSPSPSPSIHLYPPSFEAQILVPNPSLVAQILSERPKS